MSVKEIFVVMTFSVMAWKSLGLKWTTEELHTNCCKGQDKILMWNLSLENNATVQNILWFFNLTTEIAYVSESGKFDVRDMYKGRLERIGKLGILLKNVSSVDAGNYSLYLNLGPEPPENMQTISLTVIESPTYQCKPSITSYSENFIFCSTNSCGGIQLSTEWRILEQYDFVSNESYLKINSSWNAKHVSCCLHIKNMQCQNGNLLDFCASTVIFFAEDKYAPDSKYTENHKNLAPAVTIIVLATTTFLSILAVVIICFFYRNERCRLCVKRCRDTDKVQEPNNEPETLPMMRGRTSETSRTLQISETSSHRSEGRTSETSMTLQISETSFHRSEGRTSETSRTVHISGTSSHRGRSSEPSLSINYHAAGTHPSKGRSSEPSLSINYTAAGTHPSEGRSSEPSLSINYPAAGTHPSEDRTPETSRTVNIYETSSRRNEDIAM